MKTFSDLRTGNRVRIIYEKDGFNKVYEVKYCDFHQDFMSIRISDAIPYYATSNDTPNDIIFISKNEYDLDKKTYENGMTIEIVQSEEIKIKDCKKTFEQLLNLDETDLTSVGYLYTCYLKDKEGFTNFKAYLIYKIVEL